MCELASESRITIQEWRQELKQCFRQRGNTAAAIDGMRKLMCFLNIKVCKSSLVIPQNAIVKPKMSIICLILKKNLLRISRRGLKAGVFMAGAIKEPEAIHTFSIREESEDVKMMLSTCDDPHLSLSDL